jgi:ER degradation enhancer, mannosidase alpha-like 1
LKLGTNSKANTSIQRKSDIRLHFHLDNVDTVLPFGSGFGSVEHKATVTAFTSMFAGDPAVMLTEEGQRSDQRLRFSGSSPLPVIRPGEANLKGCSAYMEGSIEPGGVLFVGRGGCTFLQKLSMGKAAGAAGVIVTSDTNDPINPTADASDLDYARSQLSDVALVVVGQTEAESVSDLLDLASAHGIGVQMLVENQGRTTPHNEEWDKNALDGRVLYVNGRALINVELLV